MSVAINGKVLTGSGQGVPGGVIYLRLSDDSLSPFTASIASDGSVSFNLEPTGAGQTWDIRYSFSRATERVTVAASPTTQSFGSLTRV